MTNFETPTPGPHPPAAPRGPRFGLKALMIFVTGCCVLLAGLSALGMSPLSTLVGFTVIPLFCAAMIGVLELIAHLTKSRRGD